MINSALASPRRPVRVAYVQRPNGGGSATGLYEMLRGVDRERYEPVVLFYDRNRFCDLVARLDIPVRVLREELSGLSGCDHLLGNRKRSAIRLGRLDRLMRRDWPLARHLARWIKRERVQLVHNNNNPNLDRASIVAARLAGIPQVCHVRFLRPYDRLIDGFLARRVELFIYMSRAIEEQCREAIGIPDHRGRVIYDPFDFSMFAAARLESRKVRLEFELGPEDIVISNVGRLTRWKGQDVFIQSVARVIRRWPNARALIVGGHDSRASNMAYERELREAVDRLGLREHVIFTGDRSDVGAIMAASDVVVHSSTKPEPFGRVVVEAMAASKPVVATAAGGVPEIVRNGKTGLLVRPGDARGMAQAIEQLLADHSLAVRLGVQARLEAIARFAPKRFAEELGEVYRHIVASHATAESS